MRYIEIDSVLYVMFWMELWNDLKDISGYKYDIVKYFSYYKKLIKYIIVKLVIVLI